MADITKCTGKNCPVKSNCYRYTAKENEFRQSYFANVPLKLESNIYSCHHYWKNNKLDFTVENFSNETE